MVDNNRGQNPNSQANLLGNALKFMKTDPESQAMAVRVLSEMVEYNGVPMARREKIFRVMEEKAEEGGLREAQFCFELAGRNNQETTEIKTATLDPLDALRAKMKPSNIIDRRKKAD
jgi:hypothetical protein